MQSKEYVENLISLADELMGYQNDWEINPVSYHEVEAYATINTVAGERTVIVYCDGQKVQPLILLQSDSSFSSSEMDELIDKMNLVNYLYGNTVVAYIVPDDSDVFTLALRGTTYMTFQDNPALTARSFKRRDALVLSPVGSVVDFINNMNNNCGTDALSSLMELFDEISERK
jgi:hypothetical protein